MSAKQQLRDSGLFWERCPQKNPTHKGTVGFTLLGYKEGPTIYATDLGWFGLRKQGLDNEWFPARLYAFVRANSSGIASNNAFPFMLNDALINEVINIIREELECPG